MAKDFLRLQRDDNQVPMQAGIAFRTFDATGSAKNSPLAYSSVEIAIAIPTNAAEMILRPSTDLRVYEVTSSTSYYVIPAGVTHALGVAGMDTIFIVRDASDGTLNFYFLTV